MRLFFGLRPSLVTRTRIYHHLAPVRQAIRPVAWVPPRNLHLTLAFLGEVPAAMLDGLQVAARRSALAVDGFSLLFEQNTTGAFPGWHHPKVIWLGVQPGDALKLLYQALWQELSLMGFSPDTQGFHPHITLARVKQALSAAEVASIRQLVWSLPEEKCSEMTLLESNLTPSGPIYRELASFSFTRD